MSARRELPTPQFDVKAHVLSCARVAQLTQAQTDVLTLMLQGFCNREIAAELGVSYPTAKAHAYAIFKKFECDNVPGGRSRPVLFAKIFPLS